MERDDIIDQFDERVVVRKYEKLRCKFEIKIYYTILKNLLKSGKGELLWHRM